MKLKENSIVKLISKESLLHVVKNVQILSLGYVKHVLYKKILILKTTLSELKYFSPMSTQGKNFVDEVCVLFTRHKIHK